MKPVATVVASLVSVDSPTGTRGWLGLMANHSRLVAGIATS
jgi:hypothetical protein